MSKTAAGPYRSEKKIQFNLGKFSEASQASGFEIRIRQLDIRLPNINEARESIEHIIQTKLPESADNCKYAGKGSMGWGISWAYFEIPRTNLELLLDDCNSLPDTAVLGQDAGPKWNIEHPGDELDWWKPAELRNRKYAGKEKGTQPLLNRRIDICVGQIKDDLMGVYLVYHVD